MAIKSGQGIAIARDGVCTEASGRFQASWGFVLCTEPL